MADEAKTQEILNIFRKHLNLPALDWDCIFPDSIADVPADIKKYLTTIKHQASRTQLLSNSNMTKPQISSILPFNASNTLKGFETAYQKIKSWFDESKREVMDIDLPSSPEPQANFQFTDDSAIGSDEVPLSSTPAKKPKAPVSKIKPPQTTPAKKPKTLVSKIKPPQAYFGDAVEMPRTPLKIEANSSTLETIQTGNCTKMRIQNSVTLKNIPRLHYPLSAVQIDRNRVAIANTGSRDLFVYSFITEKQQKIEGLPTLYKPSALTTDGRSRLYLLDEVRILVFQIYEDKVKFLKTFGAEQLRSTLRGRGRPAAFGLSFNDETKQIYTFYRAREVPYVYIFSEEGTYLRRVRWESVSHFSNRPCFLTNKPNATEELVATEMKNGNLHRVLLKTAASEKLMSPPKVNRADIKIHSISAATADAKNWMLVADPKQSNIYVLDAAGRERGMCVLRKDEIEIDLSGIGEIHFEPATNILVVVKNASRSPQMGVFQLNVPEDKQDYEGPLAFERCIVESNKIYGECKFWIGKDKHLENPQHAIYIEEKSTLFVAETGTDKCLAYNMKEKAVTSMAYPGAKRPSSCIYYNSEIFVKDEKAIHKFKFDLMKKSVVHVCKLVTLEDCSPGMAAFVDENQVLSLVTLSTKYKKLQAINTETEKTSSIHVPFNLGRATVSLAGTKIMKTSSSGNLRFLCAQFGENSIFALHVSRVNGKFVSGSARIDELFACNKIMAKSQMTYPRYAQAAGLCFGGSQNQLFVTDSRGNRMHTFDNDYNYLGKVTVMGERDIRYGGMEYSSRFNTFCVTDVAKGRCAVHLMKLEH